METAPHHPNLQVWEQVSYQKLQTNIITLHHLQSPGKAGLPSHHWISLYWSHKFYAVRVPRGKINNSTAASLPWRYHFWDQLRQSGRPVVYLDFHKPYDSIPHNELLHKLRTYGVSGKLWSWFQATCRAGTKLPRLTNLNRASSL